MTSVVLCLSTCPDAATAARIAQALVGERLAACVNTIAGVQSVYRWQGAVEQAQELQLLIKTTPARLPELRQRLSELHPYEVPELIVLPIADGLPAYLQWVVDATSQASSP